MEQNSDFNLKTQLQLWRQRLRSEQSIMDADAEELNGHLLDMMDDLKENSALNEEEAFIIASKRMGTISDWGDEYRQENSNILQIRRITVLLAGVILYFFCFNLIGSMSKSLFLLLNVSIPPFVAFDWVVKFLIAIYFLILAIFLFLFLCKNRIIEFIENIPLRPKHTIWFLSFTFLLFVLDSYLVSTVKGIIKVNIFLMDRFIHIYRDFEFTFPILMIIGFILIYYRYYKAVKF